MQKVPQVTVEVIIMLSGNPWFTKTYYCIIIEKRRNISLRDFHNLTTQKTMNNQTQGKAYIHLSRLCDMAESSGEKYIS